MNLVPEGLSNAIGRQMVLADKHSPSILFGLGVVGMIGSTVLACRATLKVHEVTEKVNETIGEIEEKLEHSNAEVYNEEDATKDKATVFAKSFVGLGKLYAPSIILGAASIACLTKSHNILQKRNAALTAAYIAVDEAFKAYRRRVVEKYGEEQDFEFRYGTEEVEYTDEKGKPKTKKVVGAPSSTDYARFFDEMCGSWSKSPEYNFTYLKGKQAWFNNLLQMRGHVFLNEVYDELGIARSEAGSVVGWVIGDEGDNFIDFGIFKGENPKIRDFVNGREQSILLDFNVDGVIYDKLPADRRHARESMRPWQS